jgi:GTPase SAR1 family protein
MFKPNFQTEVQNLESTRGVVASSFAPSKGTAIEVGKGTAIEFVVFDLAGQQEYAVSHRYSLSALSSC